MAVNRSKKMFTSLILLFIFSILIFNTINVYAAYENDDFLDVTRSTIGNTAIINEEKDITYQLSSAAFDLEELEDYLAPKEIMLVVDVSGSMDFSISAYDSTKRMTKMKEAAIKFVDNFVGKNVNIGITEYSTSSKTPSTLYSMKTTTAVNTLKNTINNMVANGGTNIGDGIRRAYYALNNSPNVDSSKYVIIMTDGEPNYYTAKQYSTQYYSTYNRYNYLSTK